MKRATLIAGLVFTLSFFLSCFAGVLGCFNGLFSMLVALAGACFSMLVAGLVVKKLQSELQGNGEISTMLYPRIQLAVILSALIAAHLLTLTYNVSTSENLLGNHDQGMYLAAASHLQTNGKHSMATDWILQASAKHKRFLTKEISPSLKTESPGDVTNTGTQAGFYLMDESGASQYIQFPPGYPTVLAVFWSLGGYPLVLYSNGIICLFCGLMLVAVCGHYVRGFGTLSTWLLFLFCPLTLWSANHLYAEPLLLLLWLIALWALTVSEDYPALSATLASLAIAAAFLVKIDALPLFVLPLAYAVLISKSNRLRFRATFLALSIAAGSLSVGLYIHYSKPYFEFTFSGLFSGRLLFVAFCAALFLAATLGIPKIRLKVYAWIQANAPFIRYGLAVCIGLLLLYFYFVRPHITEPHMIFSDESGEAIESLREQTFYRLGWYLTPVGLALASAGLLTALVKQVHYVLLAFAGMATLFLIYYSYDIHCTPYQPYAMRRLFPFVVPTLCFGAPFLIQSIPVKRYSAIVKPGLTLLITTALLFQFQQINQTIILWENYKGLYAYLSEVSQRLPENERILINGKGKACIYAAPLRYVLWPGLYLGLPGLSRSRIPRDDPSVY